MSAILQKILYKKHQSCRLCRIIFTFNLKSFSLRVWHKIHHMSQKYKNHLLSSRSCHDPFIFFKKKISFFFPSFMTCSSQTVWDENTFYLKKKNITQSCYIITKLMFNIIYIPSEFWNIFCWEPKKKILRWCSDENWKFKKKKISRK